MDKKTEKTFRQRVNSDRIMETGELLELISSAKGGVSKKSLQNLTGNLLRYDFRTLLDSNLIKMKQTTALSKRLENIYYVNKKVLLNSIKELELLSYATWYLRELGLKVGKVTINENGNVMATGAISEEDYVMFEFVALSLRNYQRKLINLHKTEKVQVVLVIDDSTLVKRLSGKDVYNYVTITKTAVGKEITLSGKYKGEKLSESFDFTKLIHFKNKEEVEKINTGYEKCNELREKCVFTK